MKAHIILNGKEYKRDVPISWDQVSFEPFVNLEDCGNDVIKIISQFTLFDYDQLRKSQIVNFDALVATFAFLKTQFEPVVPKQILGYSLPKDLAYEQTQQFIDLKSYVSEYSKLTPKEQLQKYTVYCGVYACRQKDQKWCDEQSDKLGLISEDRFRSGVYDWRLAEAVAPEFLHAPAPEVVGVGNFTLLRLTALSANVNPSSPPRVTRMRKFLLVLTSWQRISLHFQRWLILRKKAVLKKKSF